MFFHTVNGKFSLTPAFHLSGNCANCEFTCCRNIAVVVLWYRDRIQCYFKIYHGTECLLYLYLDIYTVNMEEYDKITKKHWYDTESAEFILICTDFRENLRYCEFTKPCE